VLVGRGGDGGKIFAWKQFVGHLDTRYSDPAPGRRAGKRLGKATGGGSRPAAPEGPARGGFRKGSGEPDKNETGKQRTEKNRKRENRGRKTVNGKQWTNYERKKPLTENGPAKKAQYFAPLRLDRPK
jgi:hypothetical protein